MTLEPRLGPTELLPNMAAEEGDDGAAYLRQPAVRVAAHLWCLLFGQNARLWPPHRATETVTDPVLRDAHWPVGLGPPVPAAAFNWLGESQAHAAAWFNTPRAALHARAAWSSELCGPTPECAARVHDKAFAVEASHALDLFPVGLAECIEVLEPGDLSAPDALLQRLDQRIAAWPDWTQRNFTLKPRFGSSGRGRVGGRDRIDTPSVRGALPRLAARGGAVLEPWLERVGDFSVTLHVPNSDSEDTRPTIVGSLEMWNSASGVYRGHVGEVDSRGRVFSGDRDDEKLREHAAQVARFAGSLGFEGPCGVDAMRYRRPADAMNSESLRLRSVVEFNARPTMGLVTIGLVRRALPQLHQRVELTPGERRGFALVYRDAKDLDWTRRVRARLGDEAPLIDLASPIESDGPKPMLIFTRALGDLRAAREELFFA